MLHDFLGFIFRHLFKLSRDHVLTLCLARRRTVIPFSLYNTSRSRPASVHDGSSPAWSKLALNSAESIIEFVIWITLFLFSNFAQTLWVNYFTLYFSRVRHRLQFRNYLQINHHQWNFKLKSRFLLRSDLHLIYLRFINLLLPEQLDILFWGTKDLPNQVIWCRVNWLLSAVFLLLEQLFICSVLLLAF